MAIELIALKFLWGAGLGTFFFGGLWLTVHALIHSAAGAGYLAVSFLLRTGLTTLGFYWGAGGHWLAMLACLLGFLLARSAVLRISAAATRTEARHASES